MTPLFQYGESPASDPPANGTEAVLQRWPVFSGDYELVDRTELDRRVRTREITSILSVGDYDHDGQATEFLFLSAVRI